ncbi:unnamed protein product [Trichobilharzia szidati]|nr:unnamed protein product [Trichobilharzia szidati]
MTINLPPLKFDVKNSKQPVTTLNDKLKQQQQQQQGFQCSPVKHSITDKKNKLNKLLTSQLLVDEYPKLPLNINSQQPVISVTKDKNLTTPILYLTAASMLYQSQDQSVNEVSASSITSSSSIRSTDTTTTSGVQMSSISGMKDLGTPFPSTSSVSQISSSDSKIDDRLHRQQQQQQKQQQQREQTKVSIFHPSKRIFFTPLMITNFRPLLAPFVPVFIQILVNQTEAECYQTTWNLLFDDLHESYGEAKIALIKLIYYWNNENKLKHIIGKLRLDVKIMTLRLFLNELERKLLNFSRSSTMCMVQSPLLDLFLRPNKQIRCIVQHTALSQSCVQMDTLAFIMIHLLHAWECSSNPIEGKVSLGRIYGKLLISFSDKPELRGLEQSNGTGGGGGAGVGVGTGGVGEDPKTIESILFELILELCDFHFWQQLTMLKIRSVFEYISDMEKRFAKDFRIRQQQSMIQYLKKIRHDYADDSVKDVDDDDDEDDEDDEVDVNQAKDDDADADGGSRHDTAAAAAAVDNDDMKKTRLSKHKLSHKTREKLNAAEKDLKGLDETCIMDIFPPGITVTTNAAETDSLQADPNL